MGYSRPCPRERRGWDDLWTFLSFTFTFDPQEQSIPSIYQHYIGSTSVQLPHFNLALVRIPPIRVRTRFYRR